MPNKNKTHSHLIKDILFISFTLYTKYPISVGHKNKTVCAMTLLIVFAEQQSVSKRLLSVMPIRDCLCHYLPFNLKSANKP